MKEFFYDLSSFSVGWTGVQLVQSIVPNQWPIDCCMVCEFIPFHKFWLSLCMLEKLL